MRISNAAVGLVCLSGTASLLKESNAFIPKRSIQRQRQHDCSLKMASTPEEERAAALSEYLAKAHEEKLRAVREVEEKKSKEIQALKQQVEELKSSGASGGALTTAAAAPAGAVTTTPANVDLNEMTKEQLINKIFQYQEFMQDYIVKSQEQKVNAVAAAQKDVNLKWEQKLLLAGGVNGAAAVDPTTTSSPAKKDPPAEEQSSLYASRNAKVSAAAAAGKSRWNDMENKKAQILAGAKHNGAKAPAAPENDAKPPPAPVPVPPEVAAADHGMRADGGVGGLTLAERVAMGSEAAAATPAKTVPVPPEVLAADHGMRADGGVGGLTLAERVAFGAEAGAQTATSASELEVRHEDSLYQLRSMHVAKAAAAGKSRWGGMENKKCEELASSASSSLTAAAGRVNVGASIVGQ